MAPETLACVAYAAARIVRGHCSSQIYDHRRGVLLRIGGTVRGLHVGLYDYERGCNFFGTLPELWDDHERVRVMLHVDGSQFSALGPGGRRLTGRVDGGQVIVETEAGAPAALYSVEALGLPDCDGSNPAA